MVFVLLGNIDPFYLFEVTIDGSKGALGTRAPSQSNFFIFMQFLTKILSNSRFSSTPQRLVLRHLGNPGSAGRPFSWTSKQQFYHISKFKDYSGIFSVNIRNNHLEPIPLVKKLQLLFFATYSLSFPLSQD